MKKSILIAVCVALLCSCSKEAGPLSRGGWLCIESISYGAEGMAMSFNKGAVDSDFAVDLYSAGGEKVAGYSAGSVPGKIALQEGSYTLETYSANIDGWRNAASGRGEAAYRASAEFFIEADMYSYVSVQAPLVNYGVRFKMEEGLEKWFTSFSLTVGETGGRSVTFSQEQEGWFDAASVSVVLNATNTDGDSFSSKPFALHTAKGHMYTLHYSLSPATDGSLDMTITVDDRFEDAGEELTVLGE